MHNSELRLYLNCALDNPSIFTHGAQNIHLLANIYLYIYLFLFDNIFVYSILHIYIYIYIYIYIRAARGNHLVGYG